MAIYCELNKNFFYTQLAFAFVPQKDSYYTFSIVQLNFDIFLRLFFAFCLFLFQKDFDIIRQLLFRAFLCVFNNSYLSFLYIEKDIYKKCFFICFKNEFQYRSYVCKLYELLKLCELCKFYKYFMNHLKSAKIT